MAHSENTIILKQVGANNKISPGFPTGAQANLGVEI